MLLIHLMVLSFSPHFPMLSTVILWEAWTNALLKSRYIMSVALGRSLNPLTLSEEMKQIGLFEHAVHFAAWLGFCSLLGPGAPCVTPCLPSSIVYSSSMNSCSLTPANISLCLTYPPPNLEYNGVSQTVYMYWAHAYLALDIYYLMAGSTRAWTYCHSLLF